MTRPRIANGKRSCIINRSLVAGLTAVMLGCGHDTTAPVVESARSAAYEMKGAGQPVTPVAAPSTGNVVSTTRQVSALLGGTLNAGRHTLVIPPGALNKDTIITLRDVTGDRGRVECEALPEGLKFRIPATLFTRFSDLKLPQGYTMYWVVDEGTNSEEWIPVGGEISAGNIGISALLYHFSNYAPGKTGW